MESREQVALEEARIAHRTSSAEAGEKLDNMLGGWEGFGCRKSSEVEILENVEQSRVILSSKYFKNEEASKEGEL
jgi:hypothetical protein